MIVGNDLDNPGEWRPHSEPSRVCFSDAINRETTGQTGIRMDVGDDDTVRAYGEHQVVGCSGPWNIVLHAAGGVNECGGRVTSVGSYEFGSPIGGMGNDEVVGSPACAAPNARVGSSGDDFGREPGSRTRRDYEDDSNG